MYVKCHGRQAVLVGLDLFSHVAVQISHHIFGQTNIRKMVKLTVKTEMLAIVESSVMCAAAPIKTRLTVEISIMSMGMMISGTLYQQKYDMIVRVATPCII